MGILFAVLFLLGATGMEPRRGLFFVFVTAIVTCLVVAPFAIQELNVASWLSVILVGAPMLFGISFVLGTSLFFAGRWGRSLANLLSRKRLRAP